MRSRNRLQHGPYAADDAGQAARAEHRAGWEYFLPRLAAGLAGSPAGP